MIEPVLQVGAINEAFKLQAERIKELEAEAERLRAMVPRWIPVADLPPELGFVVIVTDGKCVNYDSICDDDPIEWNDGDLDVTHWMPLPSPPEPK